MAENNDSKRLWLGIIFFILGGLLLVNNLDLYYFNLPYYVFSWGSLWLLLGVYLFFGRSKRVPGGVFMAIGAVMLADDIFYWWHLDFWDLFLPGILIAIGLTLVFRKNMSKPIDPKDVDYVDDMAVFGGGEKKITSKNFKGGRSTAIFGGTKLDMSTADMGEENAELDVFMMFGGGELIVPADWTVKTEVSAIFGALSDKRNSVVNVVPDENKVLTVKGTVLFGGGEIKSA